MQLWVVRHGVAEATGPDGTDASRRLTEDGRERMRRAARGLARLGVEVEALLTSPLPRAAETAHVLCNEVPGIPPPIETDVLATGVSAMELLRQLRPWGELDTLMLVGHEPTLSDLVATLLTGSPDRGGIAFKKGGCALVDVDGLRPRGGELRWLLPPRVLRAIGRR